MAIVYYLSATSCHNKALSDSLSDTDCDVWRNRIAFFLKSMSHDCVMRSDPVFQQEGPWIFLHHNKKLAAKSIMNIHYFNWRLFIWNWGPMNAATEISCPKCSKPTETTNCPVDSGQPARRLGFIACLCNLPSVWPQVGWKWKSLSRVQLFVTPWTVQSMGFCRPEYESG